MLTGLDVRAAPGSRYGEFMPSITCLLLSLTISAQPIDSTFIAKRASAGPAKGNLVRVESDGSVVLDGNGPVTIAGADLISLRRVGKPLPPPPAGPQIVFANGDCLAGQVMAIENGNVRFKAALGSEFGDDDSPVVSIPLSALAAIWFQSPAGDAREQLAVNWARERRRRDSVYSKNGDIRTGIVKEMKSATSPLVLREEDQETRIESSQLVAIALNTDLARSLRPRSQFVRLILANGGRLGMTLVKADVLNLSGRTLFGTDVKIPLERLVCMDVWQGKAEYLSDLKPKSYEHTPYLGVRWPYEMDRSVAGNGIRLGGSAFDKGIGMHSESRLSFNLGGKYKSFDSLVGLDDRTGQGGQVKIRVLVDGKDRDIGGPVFRSSAEPRDVHIDVAGARELMLVVEFGSAGDVCDHVDWADARLIK
jgi:hypothetical protein